MSILIPSLMMCSMMFMLLNHPLSCGLMLLLQTILISLITGLMNFNFWYSYILFLIMIGGMLILFIYMTSVASNEKFKFSLKIMNLMILTFMVMLMAWFLDFFYLDSLTKIIEMKPLHTMSNNYLSMNKYLNYPNNLIMFIMIIYLFITLIAIVKITNLHYGPLRQKF